MKTPNFRRTRVAAAVAGVVLAIGAPQAFATGFQLNEQSASSLGNAFAGGAAFTDDASGMWWNPAALGYIGKNQAVAGLHIVTPMIDFNNDGSVSAANQPLGNNGGDAGTVNFIPNMYLALPINKDWTFGLGINAPFGLVTWYGDGWMGRYQALKSEVQTINVNPAISWRVAPTFVLGAGASYQHISATFTNNVNFGGVIAGAAVAGAQAGQIPASAVPGLAAGAYGAESFATGHGTDGAWGWNLGAMWDATPALRLGAGYRSEIKYKVSGDVDFNNPPTPTVAATIQPYMNALSAGVRSALYNGSINSDITLPQIANISMHWQLDPKWEILADAQWTGWSSIKDLTFVRANGSVLQSTPENFKDTWKFAVGTTYKYNEQWKARVGFAYDNTPVNDTDRTPRLPDSDRTWLTLGGQYKFSPNLWVDAAFAYLWGANANINQNAGSTAGYGLLKGNYDAAVTIFSAQLVYQFDMPK
jgi:long-chain fatty acid transport protein